MKIFAVTIKRHGGASAEASARFVALPQGNGSNSPGSGEAAMWNRIGQA
jgi:hypothetical protein